MSKTIQTDTYVGVGSEAAGQGQASVDGNIGALVGGVVAAGATALGLKFANEKTMNLVRKTPLFGSMVKSGTGAVILTATVAATIVGTITSITGYFRGKAIAEQGRQQFEALKAERDLAVGQLSAVQQTLASGPRSSHAGSVQASREAAGEITR